MVNDNNLVKPLKSWRNSANHYKHAMGDQWYRLISIIQNEITHSTFKFFRDRSMYSVCLPVTTGSITSPMGLGSDSLPVKVNLHGKETYLADSMQFHLEYMLRYLDKGVHYLMPTFRGEDADERHLCQFYHSEAEIVGDLEDVVNLIEEYIHTLCVDMLDNAGDAIKKIAGTTDHIKAVIDKKGKYPRVTLEEAIKVLDDNPEYVVTSEHGFKAISNKGEKKLIDHFGGIVWLTHHDYIAVPFYQAKSENSKYAKNADLLFGIGEVVGSGERCITGDDVRESLKEHDVSESEYEWYIYMKDKNPLKTSGFGMGMERFILFLLQHNDIRDIPIIPRFNGVEINP